MQQVQKLCLIKLLYKFENTNTILVFQLYTTMVVNRNAIGFNLYFSVHKVASNQNGTVSCCLYR